MPSERSDAYDAANLTGVIVPFSLGSMMPSLIFCMSALPITHAAMPNGNSRRYPN